jgi:CheY-like chemotaxis protein
VPGEGGSQRRSLRLLLADDNRDEVMLLQVLLRDEGHEVHTCLRGDEVLELVRLLRPDVLLCDINMPGMSGYAVAREIKQRYAIAAPLLIGVSGVWTKSPEVSLGHAIGFDHYLTKPFEPAELLRLLDSHRDEARASGAR